MAPGSPGQHHAKDNASRHLSKPVAHCKPLPVKWQNEVQRVCVCMCVSWWLSGTWGSRGRGGAIIPSKQESQPCGFE